MKDLKNKIRKIYFLKKSKDDEVLMKNASSFSVLVASLKHRLYWERRAFGALGFILFAFLTVEIIENKRLFTKLNAKESFLVPSHISNIMRVRANFISDDQLFEFAEDYINNFTNLNYDDVEIRMRYLTRYMHPALKARFKAEMATRIPFWKNNQIDQAFSFGTVESLKRESESISYLVENGKTQHKQKTFFKVTVWGTLRKYVSGKLTEPYRERIYIKFTTTPIKQDTSWMFEVWEIERKTMQDIEQEKLVQKELEEENAKN